jgi:hypothetical protein
MLIDFLRGRPAVGRVAALREVGDVPATTAVNVEEIVRGLPPSEEPAARSLFEGLIVLRTGRKAGWRAGELRREFATRGDHALPSGLPRRGDLLDTPGSTRHRQPEGLPMAGLAVEHWPVGT